MTFIQHGYVCRKSRGGQRRGNSPTAKVVRNWWLVKHHGRTGHTGSLHLGILSLPQQYVGKKIRLKIEVMTEETTEEPLDHEEINEELPFWTMSNNAKRKLFK